MHKVKCQLTLELAKEKSKEGFIDKNEKLNFETKDLVTIFDLYCFEYILHSSLEL